jgi:hypothetical protein
MEQNRAKISSASKKGSHLLTSLFFPPAVPLVLGKQGTGEGEATFGTAMARNPPQRPTAAIWNPMRPTGDAIYALGARKSR